MHFNQVFALKIALILLSYHDDQLYWAPQVRSMIRPQRRDVKVTVMPDRGQKWDLCGLWGRGGPLPGPTVPLTFDTCYLRSTASLVQTRSRDLVRPNSSRGEGECQKVAFDRFLQHHVQVGKINIVHMDPYSIIYPTLVQNVKQQTLIYDTGGTNW